MIDYSSIYPGSLHNHTEYSNLRLRDSINKLDDIITYAAELGHEVFALTDHEATCGWIKAEKVYNKLKKKYPDFKLIRGNEIYLCRNGLNADTFETGDKYYHFILLAKDLIGAKQIYELSTRAWVRAYKTGTMWRVPTYYSDLEEVIGKNPGHVIGSTACRGSALGVQLIKYKELSENVMTVAAAPALYEQIQNWCNYLQNIFGKDNFYLEFQPSADDEQKFINQETIKMANKLDIPYIITLDAHYKNKSKADIHEAYLNSQDGDREVKTFYATTYLMSTEELESFLSYMTREELDIAYNNIRKIKNKCEDYTLMKSLKIPSLIWNKSKITSIPERYFELMPTLKTFVESDFEGDGLLARLIVDRIIIDPTLQNAETFAEVENELQITWESSQVNKAHWSAYLLNLQKIIDTCWEAGTIVGPGRGSGVGFLLLYILGITQINPLRETTKTYAWRFLNPERVSVLDVDFDISGLKRGQVLRKFREVYGEDRVANVATFGTEASKAALQTAARGLGIPDDEAKYLSSLIPSDRGITRTLAQCYYGDIENDFKPIPEFRRNMEDERYSALWNVAKEIEGLVCRRGIHAGGVIFVDEDFSESTALMRATDGTITTQFDLHDCEDASLIKYDALSVEGMDRIQICLELLQTYGYRDKNLSLRELYESTIGVYNLEREDRQMWEMTWNHEILSLFQMEQSSGVQGIALTHPTSVDDLATLNSAIRLMAQEKGAESPLEKFARFKKNINYWYDELVAYGVNKKYWKALEDIVGISYGLCISQEQFMQLVQIPECGGFDLNFADRLRKSIAKKNPAAYDELEKEFFEKTKEKGCDYNLCHYVWRVLIAMNRGYGFNASHTLAYSIIGLQEMNLAFKFPIIFWNCANLIVDSGGDEDADKGTNYVKMAIALNKIRGAKIKVSLVDINTSDYNFSPDVKNNQILFGMSALAGLNAEVIQKIISGRPYKGLKDFMQRCPLNKTIMISLIKSGAFDKLEETWAKQLKANPRVAAMIYYLSVVSEPKKRITLQNFNGLAERGLIPEQLEHQRQVFYFNKYLKTKKFTIYYLLDSSALEFYEKQYDMDYIETVNGSYCIAQKTWDNLYKSEMDKARDWMKEQQEEILSSYNELLFKDMWDKYALGSISAWEMASLCFYYHEHELAHVNTDTYGIVDFFTLPEQPIVETYFRERIPIYKLDRIIGTVIGKTDNKSTVHLLTINGVVNVKFTKEYYARYNKQLSEVQSDGTKKVIEKGWFSRGNHLMITGFRREDTFIAKTYANTATEQIYKILAVSAEGSLELIHERE